MKNFLLFLCLMMALGASSQNAYIVDKKGKKIIVRDDAIDIILIDKRISYKEVGKTWEKYVAYKDLDYAIVGPYVFKSFQLDKGRKDEAYFINTETADKKLVSVAITYTSKYSSTTKYTVYVIDNNNKIIDELKFHSQRTDGDKRFGVANFVKKHFSDCPELMARLAKFEQDEDTIMGFFDAPEYIKCN